MMKKS